MGQTRHGRRIRAGINKRWRRLRGRLEDAERARIAAEERRKAEDVFVAEADKIPRFIRRLFGCRYGHTGR